MAATVIKVNRVSKRFKLPHEKTTSVKSAVINSWRHRRRFSMQQALEEVSFEVKQGEFFGIVGRNGSGKSTLLKLIAGIYQPSGGSITVNGKLVPFIELGVGFNPELSGRENVYLNGALFGFSHKEIDKQYHDIVSFAELENYMDQKLKNYSSGMQVRLAFSMAIRAQSDILLIDEVLAVGDADFQKKCFAYFRNLKKQGKTVVFVSHDMDAVREYCDRAILIEDSRLIASGSPSKIASSYLKMFESKKAAPEDEKMEKTANRWGNRQVYFTSVKCQPAKLSRSQKIKISCRASVKQDLERMLVGFSVKNEADVWLCGTNNKLVGQLLSVKKGQTLAIEWEIPNIFVPGRYFVNVAMETGSQEACDWWEEAATFDVSGEAHTGYLTEPPINLSIKTAEK